MIQIVKKFSILPVLFLCGSSLSHAATIAAFAQAIITPPTGNTGFCQSQGGDQTGFNNGALQNVSCGPTTLSFPTNQNTTATSNWGSSAAAVATFGAIGGQAVATMSGNDLQYGGSVEATAVSSFSDFFNVNDPNLAPGTEFLFTAGFQLVGTTPANSVSGGVVDFVNSTNAITLTLSTGATETFNAAAGIFTISAEVFNGERLGLTASLTLEEQLQANFVGGCTTCGYSGDQEFDYLNTLLLTSLTNSDTPGDAVVLSNTDSGTDYSQVIQANDAEITGAPEPSTMVMAGAALALLGLIRRNRRRIPTQQ